MRNSRMKPVTALIGSAFAVTLASVSFADTGANPFGAEVLAKGYALVAEEAADDDKDGEGKCGEGNCGEDMDPQARYVQTSVAQADGGDDKDGEGKCGEGKCGEGNCGEQRS